MSTRRTQLPDPRRHAILQAMGIDVWLERTAGAGENAVPGSARPADPSALDWPALRAAVAACEMCELHRSRTQTVFGVGDVQASCLVVGEAPGAEEDRRGEPFVGRAGNLLNAMLAAIGLARENVYIANILKCRPPRNRDPQADEIASCSGFLTRQIALLQPRVILAVGRIAAQNLLQTDTPIGRMRGQVYRYGAMQIPLVVTYHPAYLLRSPGEKRKAWADLQVVMTLLGDPP
jgi:uracil-DNA glycosylase family 4